MPNNIVILVIVILEHGEQKVMREFRGKNVDSQSVRKRDLFTHSFIIEKHLTKCSFVV